MEAWWPHKVDVQRHCAKQQQADRCMMFVQTEGFRRVGHFLNKSPRVPRLWLPKQKVFQSEPVHHIKPNASHKLHIRIWM